LQRQPKRHFTAIGIAEDVDMFFINVTLRDFAGDQTLDESHIVDVFGMGWEGGFRMAVIPSSILQFENNEGLSKGEVRYVTASSD